MNSIKKKRTMLTVACVVALTLSLLLTCVACRNSSEKPQEKTPLETNVLGYSKAPEFELTDQFGKQHKLSDYRGKVVYVTFSATWCDLCLLELPDLERLYHDRGRNQGEVVVLGIVLPSETSVEGAECEKTVEEMKSFLSENSLTFPVLMDLGGTTFIEYEITGLPTTYLIDREGYFIGVVQASIDKELMDHFINEALSKSNGQD